MSCLKRFASSVVDVIYFHHTRCLTDDSTAAATVPCKMKKKASTTFVNEKWACARENPLFVSVSSGTTEINNVKENTGYEVGSYETKLDHKSAQKLQTTVSFKRKKQKTEKLRVIVCGQKTISEKVWREAAEEFMELCKEADLSH